MENDEERTDEAVSKQSRRSRRHRHRRSEDTSDGGPSQASFFRHYRVEIFALSLLALGIFLLLEDLEIKAVIYDQLVWLVQHINNFGSYLASIVLGVQTSDIVGLVLMFAAMLLIAWRVRFRAINKYKNVAVLASCPKCDGNLIRLPKLLIHRVMEFLFRVRIRRFSCAKCRFRTSTWESLK